MTAVARWLVAVLLLAGLAACNRNPQAPPAATVPAAGASAPAAAASGPAMAQVLVPDTVPLAGAGTPQDVQAGTLLATQGGGSVTACVGCHGGGGEGNAQAGFPRLAALGKLYLVHQLESYANGSRTHPVMSPIATGMTPDQRLQAAAYYASLGPGTPTAAVPSAREPQLAATGDDRRQLQACVNCHGPQGIGDGAANPYLGGQHAAYLAAALGEWKAGQRNNDPSGQMPMIAKALSDDEAKALVSYYAALPPPGPRNAQAAPSMPPQGRPAVQSGPSAATAGQHGVGTEQGGPLTGGAQGQGAGGAATNPGQTAPQRP